MRNNSLNYLCFCCLICSAACQPKQELVLFEEQTVEKQAADTEKSTVNLQQIQHEQTHTNDQTTLDRVETQQWTLPYFEYQPQLRRSPFLSDHLAQLIVKQQPKKLASTASLPQPESNRIKDVLENYALKQLKFRGAIRQQDQYWVGLIELPDGYVHQVRSGQFVGLKQAKIISIQPDEITLQQKDALGQFHRSYWTRQ